MKSTMRHVLDTVCLSILLILCVKVCSIVTETGPYHGKAVICAWATRSNYRPGRGKFQLEDVDPSLCTHLIFAFTSLDDADDSVKLIGEWPDLIVDEQNINNITRMKIRYPHLKILLSIGSWEEGSIKYSRMSADPVRRSNFVNNSIQFLTKHDFDGLDIIWTFPGKRGGSISDKVNFLQLVKDLRKEFDKHKLLLTAAFGGAKDTIDNGYDVPGMSSNLDFMFMMCYDYNGWWSRVSGANAPLHGPNLLNVEYSIKHMLKLGADPNKLILGVPMYGRTYLMIEQAAPTVAPARLGGEFKNYSFNGSYTQEMEFMGYNEICVELYNSSLGWVTYWDYESKTPYSINGEKLISYENDRSLVEKTRFVIQNGLGGLMAWTIDTDDFRGDCYEFVDGRKGYPLLRAINGELNDFAKKRWEYFTDHNAVVSSDLLVNSAVNLDSSGFVCLLLLFLSLYLRKT